MESKPPGTLEGQESQPGGISQFSLEIEAKMPIFSDMAFQKSPNFQ
jgi:hypothetical protein